MRVVHQERERLGMKGRVRFTVYDHVLENIVRAEIVENLIVNGWLNRMRDAHMASLDLTVRYLAWGSGSTAPAAGNTALVTEIGRKETTQKTATGTGVLMVTTYVAPGEANAQLEEWALFGGPVSGLVMVSRVLWSHLKTATESIQVDYELAWSVV